MQSHSFKKGDFCIWRHFPLFQKTASFPFWPYVQILHFLYVLSNRSFFALFRTSFGYQCTKARPQRHFISSIYLNQFGDYSTKSGKACTAWERDLGLDLSGDDWEAINTSIHKGSLYVSIQENGYKFKSRWCRTSTLLQEIYPSVSYCCWRYNQEEITVLHSWWTWPVIQGFWRALHDTVVKVCL